MTVSLLPKSKISIQNDYIKSLCRPSMLNLLDWLLILTNWLTTVKSWKWQPQKLCTLLNGCWYLVPIFVNEEVKSYKMVFFFVRNIFKSILLWNQSLLLTASTFRKDTYIMKKKLQCRIILKQGLFDLILQGPI